MAHEKDYSYFKNPIKASWNVKIADDNILKAKGDIVINILIKGIVSFVKKGLRVH